MDYRYLETTGALNSSATAHDRVERPSWRGARRGHAGRQGSAQWRGRSIPQAIWGVIPESLARENRVFAVGEEGENLLVAALNHESIALGDRLSFLLSRPVRLLPASRDEIDVLIQNHYGEGRNASESVDSMLQEFADDEVPSPRPSRRSRTLSVLAETAIGPADADDDRDEMPRRRPGRRPRMGSDLQAPLGGPGVWFYVVEEGQRVLMRNPDGTMKVVEGPRRVWRGRRKFHRMLHHVAHPGDYLIVRYRDGRQEHLPGPADVWFDPRIHMEVACEEMLQVPAKEAVVVYSQKEGTSAVQRRIEYGPTLFMPRPGEWLHRFVWHASEGGSEGARKVPKGLIFHKLWMMPDQMYHDVTDVRTADDAVLTIRLMIFFELLDIDRMLEATHDPIGDFVNAATSDVVDFTGRHGFESFKQHTDRLNELETYRQLTSRASQCGYRINKVVYRGYGAPDRLQQMHDQAIESRTKLQLERATEQQAQELENFKLESQMLRAGSRRHEQTAEVAHQIELDRQKHEAELRQHEAQAVFRREQDRIDAETRTQLRARQDVQVREHLAELQRMGVDLTAYLTQGRADRVIEVRGSPGGPTHVHLDPSSTAPDGRENGSGPGLG